MPRKAQQLKFLFLFFILLLTACDSRTPIVNSISERDANEILVLLSTYGIDAQKVAAPTAATGATAAAQLWDITVSSNRITEALTILNKAGLPRVKGTNLLDLFGTQGLVPSEMQDRIRYQEGLAEQLANTVRKIDGILDADVQISFPTEETGNKPITASVYVKHQGVLDNPNSLLMTKLKRLVASSVPGLTVDNVTIVADRAMYSDMSQGSLDSSHRDEHTYVSIWSIILAKESVTRFQLLFYCFLIIIFLLLCVLAWLIWKMLPLLQRHGAEFLWSTKQIPLDETKTEETEQQNKNEEE